ncbi:MAG: M20/M25/M40 family metallo-hydrolase [Pseudomonadota bacterium]
MPHAAVDVHRLVRAQVDGIVELVEFYGPIVNPAALTARMEPTLLRVAGANHAPAGKRSGSDDFSFYQDKVPSLFFFLGVTAPDRLKDAAPNHSPRFEIDESGLIQGVRALSVLTLDYMGGASAED